MDKGKIHDIPFIHEYAKSLLLNVNKDNMPTTPINLIFGGGNLNELGGLGVVFYIKQLEENGLIKVNKISGCSQGSLLALLYACNLSKYNITYLTDLFTNYLVTQQTQQTQTQAPQTHTQAPHIGINMDMFMERGYTELVTQTVSHLFPSGGSGSGDDAAALMLPLRNKLYITYYDTKRQKQKVTKRFKHPQHLIECILRAGHVPFFTDGTYKYKGRYVDNVVPLLFADADGSLNLFVKQQPSYHFSFHTLREMLTLGTLVLPKKVQILAGVLECNHFFTRGKSTLLTYIHKNSYSIKIQLFVRTCIHLLLLLCIDAVIMCKNMLPLYIPTFILMLPKMILMPFFLLINRLGKFMLYSTTGYCI